MSGIAGGGLFAQTTFTWTTLNAGSASGSWATGANWSGGIVASGVGNTADFSTLDVTANSTITLDGNRTIGNIKFGDTGTATNTFWTVSAGTPGTSSLTLQTSSGTPLITADGGATSAVFMNVPIGGTQGLAKAGSASLVLTGTNTWTGGTTIQSGALQVGGGGTTGTLGSGPIVNNGSLVVSRSDAMTISDAISGTGILLKSSGGTLTLGGSNSYTGSTNLAGGTLSVATLANGGSNSGIGASSNSATSLVFTGGTLQFTGGNVTTDRLFSVGTGGATINITSGGAINFSNTGAMGFAGQSGARTLTFSSNVAGNNVMAFTIGDNGGATSLVKSGNGNLMLTGTNTYTGTTTINAGTLMVGNGGSTGTLGTGEVVNNGTLTFFRSGTVTATQVISGTGGVSTLGGGQVDLGSGNTYTGVTNFSGAGLIITAPVLANGGVASSVGASGSAATNLVLTNGITLRYTGTGASTDRLFSLGATSGGATIDASGSGPINFTNTGSIAYNSQSAARTLFLTGTNTGANTLSPAIGDNGGATSISKTGVGTWVLTGTNTYSGTTNVGGGGSLQIGNGGTSGTLGTGNVSVFGNLTFNRSDNVTVTNTISGVAGTVTKLGAGTLTLGGNNTYSGATTISGGTLSVATLSNGGVASPIGSSSSVATNLVLNGGTLQYAGTGGSTDRLFSVGTSGGTIDSSGTGAVAFTGVGSMGFNGQAGTRTVTLTGTNTGNNLLAPGIGDSGGATSLVKSGAGTWVLTGGNTYTGTTTISAGILQVGNGSTTGSLGTGAVSNSGSLVVNRSNAINITASITGTGTFVQNGTGTTTLSGLGNGWSMATVNAGTLLAGTASALGSGTFSAMTVNSPGTVGANGFPFTGVGSLAGSGTVQNGASAASTFMTGGANTSTSFSGVFQNGGTGTFSLWKTGSGTFTISGASTYTGSTLVSGGVLSVSALANGGITSNIGASTNLATNLTLNNGTLRYTGAATSTDRLFSVGTSGGTLDASGTGPLNFTNTGSIGFNSQTGARTLTLTGTSTDANTLAVLLADNGGATALSKSGTGTWVLTGANTYSGTTTVSAGTLQVGNGGTSGTLGTGNIVDNAVLVFNRSDTLTVPGNITGSGALTNAGTGTTILTGTNTYGGATLINAGSIQLGNGGTTGSVGTGAITNNGNLTVNRSNTVTLANTVMGTGSFTQAGSGTTVFTGTKSYSGATNVNAGKLQAGAASAFSPSSAVTVASGAVLEINGFNSVIGSLAGAGIVQNGSATLATLNAGSNNGSTTFSGVLQNGGSGMFAFNKAGAGTLTISGTNNSYTGGTVVSAGVLSVASITDGGTNSSIGASSSSASNLLLNGGTLAYTGPATSSNRLFSVTPLGGTLDASGTGPLNFTNTGSIGFNSQTGTRTLTLTGTNTGNNTLTAVIGDNGGATTLVKSGAGTWVIAGNNTYSGATTINAGKLQVGNGGTTGSLGSGSVVNNGNLTINRSNAITLANNITGTGSLTNDGPGTTVLSGANTYSGTTTVNAGTLLVNGSVAGSALTVNSGAALGGSGSLSTAVTVNSGGRLAPGDTIGTLTMNSLTLSAGSLSDYQLGKPGVVGAGESDLVNVTGGLTLDGTLNVSALPNFTTGAYRLFNYGTTLTDSTMGIGSVPVGYDPANFIVSKAVPNQINLIVVAGPGGPVTQFWDGPGPSNDGTIQGGNGTWNNFNANFTTPTGTTNGSWQNGVALFGATAGKVTLGDDIHFTGLQFMTTGYEVAGDLSGLQSLIPTGASMVTVDSGVVATISAPITGTGSVNKLGAGTLVLTNTNNYSGGTTITAGVLQIGNGGTTGSITGNVIDQGTLSFNRSNIFNFAGNISGVGGIAQSGTGTTILSGTNTYTGTTVVNSGILQAGSTAAFGTNAALNLTASGAVLDLAGFSNTIGTLSGVSGTTVRSTGGAATLTTGDGPGSFSVFSGTLADGAGGVLSLDKSGGNTLVLTGTNTNTGTTTISNGSLQLGDGGTAGSLGSGAIINDATLIIDRSNTVVLANSLSGSGGLEQSGAGTTILTGTNTSTGSTLIQLGRLQVGAGGTTGNLSSGLVVNDAELSFNRSDALTVGQMIVGSGSLIQEGTGVTAITNGNLYTGSTQVNAGTLLANNISGSATGAGSVFVNNGGTLGGNGAVSGAVSLHSGGTIAPGTSAVGTLTLGSLTWNGGGTVNSRVGPGGDLLQLTGSLLQGSAGSYGFSFTNNGAAVPNTPYQIIAFNGTSFARGDVFMGNALQFDPGGSPLGIFAPLFTLTSTGLYANFQGPISGPLLQNSGPIFVPTYADFVVMGSVRTGTTAQSNTVNSLTFLPSSSLTVSNTLNVNSGGLYQLGGSSTVSGGTLYAPTSFVVDVTDGASLRISSDLVSPSGMFKTGDGTLTLSGRTVLGDEAEVTDGTLVLDGTLSTPRLHIYHGATLLGTGSLFGDLLNSGIVNPGHSPGTLHVHGNYTQTSSGTLVLEVAGLNNHDRLVVSGTARLGGTLDVRNYGGHRLEYGDVVRDFLTAGRITGRFSNIAMPSPNLRGRILNEGHSLSLIAAPTSYTLVARSENQLRLARALDHWIGKEDGDVGTVTLALDLLREEEYPAALNAISPAYYAALPSVHIEQTITQSSLLSQRMSALRAGARGLSVQGVKVPSVTSSKSGKETNATTPVEDDRWGAYVQLSGQFADMESFQNLSDSRFNTATASVGLDYRIQSSMHVGMSVGYGYTELSFDKGDTSTMSEGRLAFYSTIGLGRGFFLEATVGGALSSDDVKRPVAFGTLDRTARGDATASQAFSAIAFGCDVKAGKWVFTPKTGLQYTYYHMGALDEQGAGALSLHLDRHNVQSLRYSLGAQLAYNAIEFHNVKATPYLFANWSHEFENGNSTITASLPQGAGAFDYQYRGLQRDRATAGVGLMLELGLRTSLNLGYQADFGASDYISHLIFLQLTRKF